MNEIAKINEVMSYANYTKNNNENESGILGPWIKVSWMWSRRRWHYRALTS